MKKFLLSLFGVLTALQLCAHIFKYEYEGQTLLYSVKNESSKTCDLFSTYEYADLVIPSIAKDGDVEYSVIHICQDALNGRSNMISVAIPASVTSIDAGAFSCCAKLTSINVDSDNPEYCSVNGILYNKDVTTIEAVGGGLTSVHIPNSVTSIGAAAFEGCSSLTSVTIPNSVTSIGVAAFKGCSSLTSVDIPTSVTFIWNRAFQDCSSLISMDIPNSVTEICESAFANCSSLTSVTIPSSVTTIGYDAFYGCSSLTSVDISNSMKFINHGLFEGCSSLTSVTIPSSVATIGDYAFYGCSSLTSVTISSSVTSIWFGAFYGCNNLADIYVYNPVPPEISCDYDDAFSNYSATLHVLEGCAEAYRSAPVWSNFTTIKDDLSAGIEDVAAGADPFASVEVYNLLGVKAGTSLDGLGAGTYIVRQGNTVKKIFVR